MFTDKTIAVIGAGNMGQALIGGLLRQEDVAPHQIIATRRNAEALKKVAGRFEGIRTSQDNLASARDADVILLAVKPQNAADVLADMKDVVDDSKLVVSILAGLKSASISTLLGGNIPVVRSMPNTPSLVDQGATAIAMGEHCSEADAALAHGIFESVGIVEVVPEDLMDAVTGLSGSGPAYIYMVIEALTDGGVKQGLKRPTARRLAAQTVYGAAKLVLETDKHPAILRDEVTTPGGTAIAAIANLEDNGLRTVLINAVQTATERSRQLSEQDD